MHPSPAGGHSSWPRSPLRRAASVVVALVALVLVVAPATSAGPQRDKEPRQQEDAEPRDRREPGHDREDKGREREPTGKDEAQDPSSRQRGEDDEGAQADLILGTTAAGSAAVGDDVDYRITVSNEGDAEAHDVVVVDLVPDELDVAGVAPVDEAEAIQSGRSARGEDIVWVLGDVAAGGSVQLPWSATVVEAGDGEATNTVEATVEGQPAARDVHSLEIAQVKGKTVEKRPGAEDPQGEPGAAEAEPGAATASPDEQGRLLPATGTGRAALLLVALALVGTGLAILRSAAAKRR